MKTIFISAFTNFVVRNIFETDFLLTLKKDRNLRLVIIAPETERDYLFNNFGGPNLVVEGVKILPLTTTQVLIGKFSRLFLNTYTIRLFNRLRTDFRNPLSFLPYYFGRALSPWLQGWLPGIRLVRWLDYHCVRRSRFTNLFDRYQPDLIFSTDITDRSSGESDIDLLREAKRRGTKTVGMVRSWDNLTTRGVIREVPDQIIVHNEIIKNECLALNGIAEERVRVVGVPHYDKYLRAKLQPRETFLKKIGLDPRKKTILFVTIADMFLEKQLGGKTPTYNRYCLEQLSRLDAKHNQILVRFPLIGGGELGDFQPPTNMVLDRPATLFGKGELSAEADDYLINVLAHSDVVLPGPSTIAIDAMLFDRPIVWIGFDKEKNLPLEKSVTKFMYVEHLRPLMDFKALRIAKNESELLSMIEAYLKNPALDRAERKAVITRTCFKTDGQSSERLAQAVLSAF